VKMTQLSRNTFKSPGQPRFPVSNDSTDHKALSLQRLFHHPIGVQGLRGDEAVENDAMFPDIQPYENSEFLPAFPKEGGIGYQHNLSRNFGNAIGFIGMDLILDPSSGTVVKPGKLTEGVAMIEILLEQ